MESLSEIIQSLGGIAQLREWGLIIILVVVLIVWAKSTLTAIMKMLEARDKVNGEREERMIRVMVGFGDSLPKLAAAIDELRGWLNERFKDVDEGLGELKEQHTNIVEQLDDHEVRIGKLEQPK